MKVLKHILFTVVMVVGIAMTASAQEQKKPPQKPPPPVIKVPDKPPPKPKEDKPKGDGKKPGMAWVTVKSESYLELV